MMPVSKHPSVFSLEPRKTIYVTGVTKTLATGWRLGFIIASTSLLHPLMGGVRSTTWMPPPLMLEILTWWIEEGMIDEIINWHRREIMARLKIAKAVLGSGRLCCDPGKYNVWMRITPRSEERSVGKECVSTWSSRWSP